MRALPVVAWAGFAELRLDVPFEALPGREVARHPANSLMAQGVRAGQYDKLVTLLAMGVGGAGYFLAEGPVPPPYWASWRQAGEEDAVSAACHPIRRRGSD